MNKRRNDTIEALGASGAIPQQVLKKLLRAMRFMVERAWEFIRKKKALIIEGCEYHASIRAQLARKYPRQEMQFDVVLTTCQPTQTGRRRTAAFRTTNAVFAVRQPTAFMAYN